MNRAAHIILVLVLATFGAACADRKTRCAALGVEDCAKHDDECGVVNLSPWNESNQCWDPSEPAGCLPRDVICDDVLSCALDEEGNLWLSVACAPYGWTGEPNPDAGSEICSGQPRCN